MSINDEVVAKDQSFSNLDFGTIPTGAMTETIQVEINPETMVTAFAGAYAKELVRRNPIRANDPQSQVTADELDTYFQGLLKIRVESVDNNCKVWRQAKRLVIPAWIQFALSRVGVVRIPEEGLIFTPVINVDYDIDKLLEISDKLRNYIPDGIKVFEDAFPRSEKGDIETMTMCLIENTVNGHKLSHPVSSYVAAFLGFRARSDMASKALYRIRYDDVDFITSMIIHEGSLF